MKMNTTNNSTPKKHQFYVKSRLLIFLSWRVFFPKVFFGLFHDKIDKMITNIKTNHFLKYKFKKENTFCFVLRKLQLDDQ